MNETIMKNEESEAFFNAIQFLSMKAIGGLVDIHSLVPEGDIEACMGRMDEIRDILESLNSALDAINALAHVDAEDTDQKDYDDIDDLQDYLNEEDEGLEEPVSLDEMDDNDKEES